MPERSVASVSLSLMRKKQPQQQQQAKEKSCYFCVNMYHEIDYKDPQMLRRFMSSYAKIAPTRRSGLCSKHQRKLSVAIKKARIMAIVPFTRR